MSISRPKFCVVVKRLDGYDSSVPFPPIGSSGEAVSEFDNEGDCDVIIYDHPCPVGEESWVAHKSMIRFLDHNTDIDFVWTPEEVTA